MSGWIIVVATAIAMASIVALACYAHNLKSKLAKVEEQFSFDYQVAVRNIEYLKAQRLQLMDERDRLSIEYSNELRNSTKKIKAARADAVKRATAVAHGFESENFAPLIDERWNHKDFRHMGDPIDYLVLDGMSDIRGNSKLPLEEVVLLDIKTGGSQLNTIQRRIRDAVIEGRVRFAVFNTDTGITRAWPPYEKQKDKQLELLKK